MSGSPWADRPPATGIIQVGRLVRVVFWAVLAAAAALWAAWSASTAGDDRPAGAGSASVAADPAASVTAEHYVEIVE